MVTRAERTRLKLIQEEKDLSIKIADLEEKIRNISET